MCVLAHQQTAPCASPVPRNQLYETHRLQRQLGGSSPPRAWDHVSIHRVYCATVLSLKTGGNSSNLDAKNTRVICILARPSLRRAAHAFCSNSLKILCTHRWRLVVSLQPCISVQSRARSARTSTASFPPPTPPRTVCTSGPTPRTHFCHPLEVNQKLHGSLCVITLLNCRNSAF